jgi:hypothetical protein
MKKISFLRIDCGIDLCTLQNELISLSAKPWQTSTHAVHAKTDMIILRGGRQGGPNDLCSDDTIDHQLLSELPQFTRLLSKNGPLGGASNAYIFRLPAHTTVPMHVDSANKWASHFRIHVPIITHPQATLIVEDKGLHLDAGYAWSFNNNAKHGVINGPEARTHLLMDVPPNPTLFSALELATWIEGHSHGLKRLNLQALQTPFYPGNVKIRHLILNMRAKGSSDKHIAAILQKLNTPTQHAGGCWTEKMVTSIIESFVQN